MPFLQTTIKTGFITDLVLPRPGTNGKSAEEIEQIAHEIGVGFMQDFLNWPRMNPLVHNIEFIHHTHDKYIDVPAMAAEFGIDLNAPYATSEFKQVAITDKMNVFLGYTTDLVYHSAMRTTVDGMEGLTDPGSGVKIYGRFEMKKSSEQEGVLHLIETNETRCNRFLGVYIKATLGSSHKHMHENFKKKWNDDMKRKMAL